MLETLYKALGIGDAELEKFNLEPHEEASVSELVAIDLDFEGKPILLTQAAAQAWQHLCEAAEADSVVLTPYSGFRSYLYQKVVIARRVDSGMKIMDVLTRIAIPGFSEHHTGRAIDIITDDCEKLTEDFEQTQAFAWLGKNAERFGFRMSYPRDNTHGIVYEPWHWCYQIEFRLMG